jgi:hypothetical protein
MQLAPSAPCVAARAPAAAAAPAAAPAAAAAAAPLRASRGAFAGARVPCTPSGARGGAARAGGRSCGGARTVAAIKKCSKRSVVKAAVLHAEEGQADAVRALCLAHMNAVNTAKARRGAHNTQAATRTSLFARPTTLSDGRKPYAHFFSLFRLWRCPPARRRATRRWASPPSTCTRTRSSRARSTSGSATTRRPRWRHSALGRRSRRSRPRRAVAHPRGRVCVCVCVAWLWAERAGWARAGAGACGPRGAERRR